MSDTPRTDTQSFNAVWADPATANPDYIQSVVEAAFARDLERQLKAMTEARDALQSRHQVCNAPTWADGMERAAGLCEEEAASAQALLNENPHIGAMAKDRVSGIRNAMDLMAKTIRAFKEAGPEMNGVTEGSEFVAGKKP